MKVNDIRGDEKALRLVNSAPELADCEKDRINRVFPSYIFRVRKKREIWTTCCSTHKVITAKEETAAERKVLDAPHSPEPKFSWGRQLNQLPPMVPCPYCGKIGTVKELGRTGGRGNLSAYKRVVALRWYRGNLWARAYQCAKHYNGKQDTLCVPPEMGLVGVWRFRPGDVRQAHRSYMWWGRSLSPFGYYEQTGPLKKGKWDVMLQFGFSSDDGMDYDVVGIEEVDKSPFRWCGCAAYLKEHYRCLKFLTACCFYPRQIEMFMKAGMMPVVFDLVERCVKNARAFNWEETDPVKGFGLTKQELRAFMAGKREIDTVILYKQLKRMEEPVTVERVAEIRQKLYRQEKAWLKQAKRWDLRPMKLYRYFERQNERPSAAMSAWIDYVRCGEALGYQLQRSNILLPEDLGEAHDRAAEEHRRQLQRERDLAERNRKKAEANRIKKLEKGYEVYRKELEKKYAVELGGFVILVPKNSQEILDEGRILKHCVAGYAPRHMEGKTVILFMRPVDKPDAPFLTIEMDGKNLRQIHGYRNEGLYSAKGRFAPDPREAYRDILDPWLKWVLGGSKRNKKGQPVGLSVTKTEVKTA